MQATNQRSSVPLCVVVILERKVRAVIGVTGLVSFGTVKLVELCECVISIVLYKGVCG